MKKIRIKMITENRCNNLIKKYKDEIIELKKQLDFQCKQTKKFGDELLQFKKKKENAMYEIKLKQYRDEIIELKLGKE